MLHQKEQSNIIVCISLHTFVSAHGEMGMLT